VATRIADSGAPVDLRQPNDPIPAGELTQDCRDDLRQQNDQL